MDSRPLFLLFMQQASGLRYNFCIARFQRALEPTAWRRYKRIAGRWPAIGDAVIKLK